jgi:hypothetical protein
VPSDESRSHHAFDISIGICERCDITWAQYVAAGKPPCPGQSAEPAKRDWRDHWIIDVLMLFGLG